MRQPRNHGRSPTGLSHSTSAPGNIGYPKSRENRKQNENESSDESQSNNQQNSRPGSSRDKVKSKLACGQMSKRFFSMVLKGSKSQKTMF